MTPRFAMLRRFAASLAGAFFAAALPLAAQASEDVDIFGGKGGDATDPNVLIVLDSSSNWNATLGPNPLGPCGARLVPPPPKYLKASNIVLP